MCVFCEIINKQAPAHIVYEDSMLISFLDIDPIHEGHVLIVPKQHVDSIDKLPDDMIFAVMNAAKKIVAAFNEVYGNEGYGIMHNGGKYCDFGHAHFHVFPRYDNDGFGWTYPEDMPEYSGKVAEKLIKALKRQTYV